MSNGFDRLKTVVDCEPAMFDDAVAVAIRDIHDEGAQIVHVRFDTQSEKDTIVYIAHIMIRTPKPKKEEGVA